MYSEVGLIDGRSATSDRQWANASAADAGGAKLGAPDLSQRTTYAPPRSSRPIGLMGSLAIVGGALALLYWTARISIVPPASAGRDTVVVSVALGQATPQPRAKKVPPPTAHASMRPRAAAPPPDPKRSPPPEPTEPAQPAAPSDGPGARSNRSAGQQADAMAAPPATMTPDGGATAARDNVAVQRESAKADWQARLIAHLRQYRRYPRAAESAGQQGVVTISITLDRQGRVLDVRLRHGSGYPLLDTEALATAHRASPLPAPDASVSGDPVRVEVPVLFSLSDHER